MTPMAARAAAWLGGYAAVVLLPLVVAAAGDPWPRPRPWPAEASVAVGFLAFSVLTLQVVLVARLGTASRALGSDALMQLHRGMGLVACVLVLAHPLLLASGATAIGWRAWSPWSGGAFLQTGAVALWATLAVVLTSVLRARLHLRYEAWHVLHVLLALAVLAAMTVHILQAGGYAARPVLRVVVLIYANAALITVVHYRIVRPWRLTRRPWTVAANDDVGGRTRLLRLRPEGHAGVGFAPGQFIWLSTGRSPLVSQQHPLSIASSAEQAGDGGIEVAIKDLGDWSGRTVPALAPGARVWVDGPFGAFSPDRYPAARGFVFVAGGIGIAPIRAMLLTLRDRQDPRPMVLFHAAADPERRVFAQELEALAPALDLRVVAAYEAPPDGWTGERGYVTGDVLRRHVGPALLTWHTFACGPLPMMSAIERDLRRLGVRASHVHTERFQMV